MKTKSTKWLFIIIATLILLIILTVFFIKDFKKGSQKIKEKQASCQYLKSDHFGGFVDYIGFTDCFDIFSIGNTSYNIDGKNTKAYIINDDKNDYVLAIIDDFNDYKIFNNQLFILDDFYSKIAAPDRKDPVNYGQQFYVNGEVKTFTYPHLPDVPKYIQVEMGSGEVILYNTYDQMSDEVRGVFQNLEK